MIGSYPQEFRKMKLVKEIKGMQGSKLKVLIEIKRNLINFEVLGQKILMGPRNFKLQYLRDEILIIKKRSTLFLLKMNVKNL